MGVELRDELEALPAGKVGEETKWLTRGYLLCMHYRMKGFRVLQVEGEAEGVSPVTER